MKKYNYIRLSKTKKLRYMGNFFKKKLYIIFLPGFMSNIEGEKPKAFKRYAVKKKLGYLTLDYSGHGKSSGKFTCLLYTSPSPRDRQKSRMPSSA